MDIVQCDTVIILYKTESEDGNLILINSATGKTDVSSRNLTPSAVHEITSCND